jgi:hypothetical protein
MSPKHVVIIGAARSGTKILRDALAAATGAGYVPYDIGYVWRMGNEDLPDDVIQPERVSQRSQRFIRKFVDRYAAGDPSAVIEKTVGNTLRVPAVAAVFPDAVYVHLIRDGIDVIESTRRQWTTATDSRYVLSKLRHFPLRLVPSYGLKYVQSLLHRRVDDQSRVGSWGARYPGIDHDLHQTDLLTVSARQWREAVRYATADLADVPAPVIEVRYEELISDPSGTLSRIADFVGLTIPPVRLTAAMSTIVAGRQGAGREALTLAELGVLETEVGDTLAGLGYDRPRPHDSVTDET